MTQEIRIRPEALGGVERQLWGGIDEYCGFRLESLSPSLPVSASADHDGRLVSLMESALAAFHTVISQDVSNVRGIGDSLASTDRIMAGKLESGSGR